MIELINNYTFKSFKNYSGPNSEDRFKQKNIFFGYNGKGKTALSKGILAEIKKDSSLTDENYRFFNKDFIKDNLLLENNVDLKGIVANFGKENVDIEKAIEEKMKNYKDISPIQKGKEQAEQNIKNEVNRIFDSKKGNSSIKKRTSESVKELVSSYEKDLEAALKVVKSKDDLKNVKDSSSYEKELNTLQGIELLTIQTLTNDEIDTISSIMNRNYEKNEIPSAEVLSWLEQGLTIHKHDNSKKCKFCGSSIEINEIEETINNYLNDKKQKDLITLNGLHIKIKSIIELDLKNNEDLMSNLVNDSIHKYYDALCDNQQQLISINEKIKTKLDNFEKNEPFDSATLKHIMSNINDNQLEISNSKHEKEKELSKMIEKSNTLIKGSIALEISESKTIADELKELEIKEKEIVSVSSSNSILTREINELKNSKSTTNDFANFINGLLQELGIDFYLDIINNNYTIKHRKDDISLTINDISEGENNLLALLFFYYELFNDKLQQNFKDEIKCIIIDDPISSVDDVNKVYVLELIKKLLELSNPQVFIFTHVWDDFCNMSYGKSDKKDGNGNETPYRFYEIKKNEKGSYIVKTKTNETPYMHDFKEIYEFSKKDNADDLDECEMYHYPNVMRKVLEQFMKFKVKKSSPTLDNITNVKIALCGDVNCSHQDDIQIPALLDICNILSHQTVRTPDQVLKSAKYLMRKIKETDKNHFSAMTN